MATTTWTGAVSNTYSDPNNWDNGVPTSIKQGFVATANADVQIAANSIINSGLALGGATAATAVTLEALGNLTYSGFSAISDLGTGVPDRFVIKINGGTLTNFANISVSGVNTFGTILFNGALSTLANSSINGQFGYVSAFNGASLLITAGGTLALGNVIQANDTGTTLTVLSPVISDGSSSGKVVVGNGATVELGSSVSSLVTLQFASINGVSASPVGGLLKIDARATYAAPITQFFDPAKTIDLVAAGAGAVGAPTLLFSEAQGVATVVIRDVTGAGPRTVATLTFNDPQGRYLAASATTGGFTVATANITDYVVNTTLIACFAAGTRIATVDGPVAVESLRLGDLVHSAFGGTAPIKWIGHRRVDCARHPRPSDVHPIEVQADAFAPGQPSTTLRLSPDHAVHVAGRLIPIRYLVNGASIRQQPVDSVTYWHVELPAHDVLLAENLACESYLDTGNRAAFAGQPVTMAHPDFALRVWEAESCAPLLTEGPALAAIRADLLARAETLGHATTSDAAIHLLVDGTPVAGVATGNRLRFRIPPGATAIELASRNRRPAEMSAADPDHRRVGIAVAAIEIDGADLALDDPRLTTGWHSREPGWRWTDGRATLPAAREIAITLALDTHYWQAA